MKKHEIEGLVFSVNSRLEKLRSDLMQSGALEFNSSLPNNAEECYSALLKKRMVSKFDKPCTSDVKSLKAKCFDQWLRYDQTHKSVNFFELPIQVRQDFAGARQVFRSTLKDFSYFYNEVAQLELPKRETWVSKKGYINYYEKLRDKSVWTVTPDCLDLAIELVLCNSGLRALAKKHLPRLTREGYTKLHRRYGVMVFEHRLRNELFTVVQGSRASSVPKNNEKRRFINIEPFFNVIVQKKIGQAIRMCLKKNLKIDLDTGQSLHRKMIKSSFVCTIDIENASDSTFLDLIRCWMPSNVLQLVELSRSPFTLIETDNGRKNYVWPKKVSSMGNGFTFELLTLTLASMCKYFDPNSSVYGDDIIIAKIYANRLVALMQSVGYNTNEQKTFISHIVRESCGAFFIEGYGYISSYDIKYCHNINDVINTVNKLGRIIRNLPVENYVTSVYKSAYVDVLSLIPSLYRGPLSNSTDLPNWVECESLKNRRKKPEVVKAYRYAVDKYADVLSSWCIDVNASPGDQFYHDIHVGVVWEPKVTEYLRPTYQPNFWLSMYYLYIGRRGGISRRMQKQHYRPTKCLFIDGVPVTLREMRRIQKGL